MAGDTEVKLDQLISQVTLLTSVMNNVSQSVSSFQNFENMFTNLHNHFNTVEASLENRIKTIESSLENKVEIVDTSLTEERNNLMSDVAELSTLMDTHCKGSWTFEEAVNLVSTVTRFKMKNMSDKLSNTLKNALTVTNCIQVFQLASQYEMEDLWEASKKWISKNFVLVYQSTSDFWNLTLDEMCVFVYCETLCANQEDVFKAINKWVNYDRPHRAVSCSVLLRAIQLHQCTTQFLQSMLDHYLVVGNPDIWYAVEAVVKELTGAPPGSTSVEETEGKDLLFVLGGNDSEGVIETFNGTSSPWTVQIDLTDGPDGEVYAFTVGLRILVLEVIKKRFRSFNTLSKKWIDLRPLPDTRAGVAAAVEKNLLFVIGGMDNETRCDIYDIELNSWKESTKLNNSRSWSAASSLKGKVYCCGGENGGNRDSVDSLSSMEVFDPKGKVRQWTMAASMLVGRNEHCLVACKNYLWAVGGWNDSSGYVTDLDRFEPLSNTWTKMTSMSTGRAALTASFLGGHLYAIGGSDSKETNTVEVYKPSENRWTAGASLNRSRSSHASCVVKDMANAHK